MEGKHLFTPGPVKVAPHVLEEMAKSLISHRGREFQELYTETTRILEDISHTPQGGHALLVPGSGTTAVDAMVMSLLTPNDRVLVPVWGEFGERLATTVSLSGAETIVKEYPPGTAPPVEELVEYAERYNVTAVALVHNETGTGLAYRGLEELARKLRGLGVRLLVDSVSGFAGEAIRVDWGIHAMATCTHKALWAPPGLGIVIISPEAAEALEREPPTRAPASIDLARYLKFKTQRRETPFTPPVNVMRALRRALADIVEEGGVERRIETHARRAEVLYRLEEEGAEPLVRDRVLRSNTVVALRTHTDATRVKETLEARGFVVAAGMGALKKTIVRIGTMGAHSMEVVERLAEAVREAIVG